MPGRLGNADLYIGMVRKRKSLPRDSRGFEPIEAYLKEVEEDLNRKSSSEGESGDETDVEEEKRKEGEALALKRQERERKIREREEAIREREEKEKEELRKAEEEVRQRSEKERESEKEKGARATRGTQGRKSGRQGSRRSLRQRGMAASDTESSATDTEEGVGVGGSDRGLAGSGSERETEAEHRGPETQRKKKSAKQGRQPRTSVGPARDEPTAKPVGEQVTAEGVQRPPVADERESREEDRPGGGVVDGALLYSPEVGPTSPTRDTVKVGPIRLTFSVSPSDDERRKARASDDDRRKTRARESSDDDRRKARARDGSDDERRKTRTRDGSDDDRRKTRAREGSDDERRKTRTRDGSDDDRRKTRAREGSNDDRKKARAREGSDDERRKARAREGPAVGKKQQISRHSLAQTAVTQPTHSAPPEPEPAQSGLSVTTLRSEMSFNPKKTSTQVRGSAKRGGVAWKRSRPAVVHDPESEEEEEEDLELLSLLEPSARVSHLVGLSQLTRGRRSERGAGSRDEAETTDEDAELPVEASASARGRVKSKSAIRSAARERSTATPTGLAKKSSPTGPAKKSSPTGLAATKKSSKSSRKSVVFNPHTTNLGSPNMAHPAQLAPPSPGSDTGGGVYDYVPSDEEDLSHSKSRLYSPHRKSMLRKAVASAKRRSRVQPTNSPEAGANRDNDSEPTGSDAEEMRPEVGGARRRGGSVRELSIKVEDISNGAQWFVPDALSLHQEISDKSPRSLQRLTRSGRRPFAISGSADSSTMTVVAPGKRSRKRRPAELESTAGGSNREGAEDNSGSQSVGTSSANEASTMSSGKSGKKQTKSQRKISGSRVASSQPRKNRKKKVTPQPPSDPADTEEEDEIQHTPALKKTRVSTPEEDEGMQSGGPLSFSSSDEGESQELVRSLGGRRYRRYIVEHQDTKTPGVRRSKRCRVAPVQRWKNEELEYERRRSGVTLKGVLVPAGGTEKKPGRKRRESTPPAQDEPPPLIITDKHGVKRTFPVVTHPSRCDKMNGKGELATKTDDIRIIKLCSSMSTSCGLLELTYLGEKEKSNSKTHEVFFFVLKGRPQFTVGRQTYDLMTESQIRVPAGVPYGIKNMHRTTARLYFYSHLIADSP